MFKRLRERGKSRVDAAKDSAEEKAGAVEAATDDVIDKVEEIKKKAKTTKKEITKEEAEKILKQENENNIILSSLRVYSILRAIHSQAVQYLLLYKRRAKNHLSHARCAENCGSALTHR